MASLNVKVQYQSGRFDGYEAARCAIGGEWIGIFYADAIHLAHELVHACQFQCREADPDVYFDMMGSSEKREEEARRLASVWLRRWSERLNEVLDELVQTGEIGVPLDKLISWYLKDR